MILERIRLWRLSTAQLKLADYEDRRRKWGWSNKPSEDAWEEKRIARQRRKVERLGGEA